MKRYLLLLVCLILLSCKNEVGSDVVVSEVTEGGVKYPNHRITYEMVGDSITIHRNYPSRVRLDSVTLKRIDMEYSALTPITFDPNDSLLYDSIQTEIDSFNQSMVDRHLYSELATIHIFADDTVLIENLFNIVIKPINKRYRKFALNTHPLSVAEHKYQGCSEINYLEGTSYISYDIYGFNEVLTTENYRVLDSLHQNTENALTKNFQGMSLEIDFLIPNIGSYCVDTKGDQITIEQVISSLSLIGTNPAIYFEFRSPDEYPEPTIFPLDEYYGKASIGFYNNSQHISMQLDTFNTLLAKFPFTDSTLTFLSVSDTNTLQYYVYTGDTEVRVDWTGKYAQCTIFESGFVVSKYDVIPFIEEKLMLLGLDYYERKLFRRYWVKELVKNEYSLINFATDQYEEAVPMIVTPEPDKRIRIMMCFKAVDSSFQIPEQVLTPVDADRSGFTVVEWGGSNYDRDHLVQ